MESSDEEGEIQAATVTNYSLVNSDEEPVSFSTLPIHWTQTEHEQTTIADKPLFLRGTVENACQTVYRKVIAWRFDLSFVHPEIHALVCGKNKRWIKLQKPRKSYEEDVRGVLVSVQCLHFLKRSLCGVCRDSLWKHVRSVFSGFEVPASESDVVEHLGWVREAAMRDKDIGVAENLESLLSEMLSKGKDSHEETRHVKKVSFIVEDEVPSQSDDPDEGGDYIDELFDRVCALCDDGGDLLGCEGRCIRSFHMTVESGDSASCESLCYTSAEVEAIQTFLCKNCQYQRHQCFKCGSLGSSDRSSGAEVFPCVSATCGYFYHPKCVAELVFPNDDAQSQDFQKQIEQGESFLCPCHKCLVCNQVENKQVHELQFAVCRRCPKAYHRKCLPRNYLFEADEEKGIPQRAWENLLNKRILIYCMDHKIYRSTLTPKRDHLLFPDVRRNEQGEKVLLETRSKAFGNRVIPNEGQKISKGTNTSGPKSIVLPDQRMPRKLPIMDYSKLQQKHDQPVSLMGMKRASVKDVPAGGTSHIEDLEMQNRIRKMMARSTSSFNFEEFVDQQTKNMGHFNSSNFRLDKTMTLGKVEHSVKAMETALSIIQNGGSIEDATAVCEPGVLTQMMKWKNKLRVYLSPFLHGKRYTSFGRHFTNLEKLKEIVDRLCWYVKDDDTIVDFGCGSNDFSCLMKEKLDSMGRRCYFKNYDLIQPKNDFNYEQRDWMSIRLDELPDGNNLIIGLNPPFGVNAYLANQFINHALTFRPKLLILIVPKETHSLERKRTPYDLIWVDDRILQGKSFYLPGSTDVNGDVLEQWNNETVPLFLWSRPDWTPHHRSIAIQHGQLIITPEMEYPVPPIIPPVIPNDFPNYLMEEPLDGPDNFDKFLAREYVEDDIYRMIEDI